MKEIYSAFVEITDRGVTFPLSREIEETTNKAWSIGVVVARFLHWYKTDNSGIMPTPSNAQWFWMGTIAVIAITVKVLQELNLIGVWVIY